MSAPYVVSFGPWVPDGVNSVYEYDGQYSATEVPLSDISNVIYYNGAYRNIKSGAAVAAGSSLGSACLGAYAAIDSGGAQALYAGDATNLYSWDGSAWTSVGSGYSASKWRFAQFNNCINATNGVDQIQGQSIGGGAFGNLATGAPTGNVLGVVNQFLIVGDITATAQTQSVYSDPTATAYPNRIHWSALGNDANWPTPLTTDAYAFQAGYQDMEGLYGPVMFIGGLEQYGVVMQKTGISRMSYVGGDQVFSFEPFERKRGLVTQDAACQVGRYIFFLADDGFYYTDGSSVQSIGQGVIDDWFWENVNASQIDSITAGYDSNSRSVYFSIPTGVNTSPDTLLSYNPEEKKWCKSSIPAGIVFTDFDGTRHTLGLFDSSGVYQRLTGAALSGYMETYDLAFTDSMRRLITGIKPNTGGSPTCRAGSRVSLQDSVSYTADVPTDSFTGVSPIISGGTYNRIRVTASNLAPAYGAVIYANTEGEV